MTIDKIIDGLVAEHGLEPVLGAIIRHNGDSSQASYDKSFPLEDPTQSRSAEINRQKKVFKIAICKVTLIAVDCLARSQDMNRSDFVTGLVADFCFEFAGTRKGLIGAVKRKQVGLRLTPDVIEVIQAKALEANTSPGKWLGCLLEAYTQQLGQ